ncbi:MAG: SDR family oxidoreductase [Candidatus Obscuribacterales bacterium]|nr:SDR family oxidoreductase [Candidatus Obscuribacterales bacterium]
MNPSLVTVVTGGGRGIGKAVALKIAAETAVMVVGRSRKDLQAVCAEIKAAGGVAEYCVGDVSRPATAKRCLTKIANLGWTVRNLVLNAGIAKGGACTKIEHKVWKQMFAVNVNGAFYFAKTFLPGMVEQKAGTISVISSIAGLKGFKYQSAYCATKHALVGMATSWALEYAKYGIVVVPICPGFVATDMTQQTLDSLVRHRNISLAEAEAIVADENPQKRIIQAEEIADAVLTVCQNKIPSLNGHPLVLSGGA